jgi:hypothetical protein
VSRSVADHDNSRMVGIRNPLGHHTFVKGHSDSRTMPFVSESERSRLTLRRQRQERAAPQICLIPMRRPETFRSKHRTRSARIHLQPERYPRWKPALFLSCFRQTESDIPRSSSHISMQQNKSVESVKAGVRAAPDGFIRAIARVFRSDTHPQSQGPAATRRLGLPSQCHESEHRYVCYTPSMNPDDPPSTA